MYVPREYHWVFDELPEDVKFILALFPTNEFSFCTDSTGRYYDIQQGDNYFFYQPIARSDDAVEKNRKRFISWVRNGMPEGHTDVTKFWEKED